MTNLRYNMLQLYGRGHLSVGYVAYTLVGCCFFSDRESGVDILHTITLQDRQQAESWQMMLFLISVEISCTKPVDAEALKRRTFLGLLPSIVASLWPKLGDHPFCH